MIVVTAELEFADKQARDSAVEKTTPIQMATRADEPGCIAYCFGADPGVDTRVQVYELWDTAENLAAHLKHPNYFKMLETLMGSNLVDSANRAYLVEREESVYGEDGKPKSAFFTD
ncbi:MAG: antibiotic biosynthesis monooxygenase [Pseudomonadota bacterium]